MAKIRDQRDTPLRRAREAAGLTQKQLAEKSGVSLSLIRNFEQEDRDITITSLKCAVSLATVCGCKLWEIIPPSELAEKLKQC